MECNFTKGFVAACAVTLKNHGCDVIVADTLSCCGPVSAERFRRLGVDEYDIEILMPIIKEIKRKSAGSTLRKRGLLRPTAKAAQCQGPLRAFGESLAGYER